MTKIHRIYNCKDEELVPLTKFTLYALSRDLADFTAFSPKFNAAYVANFEAQISKVENLLEPGTELLARTIIHTARLVLISDANKLAQKLDGYLILAKPILSMTKANFSLVSLRKALHNKDIEAIINQLSIVTQNIERFLAELKTVGVTDEYIDDLKRLRTELSSNREKQLEIDSNRKALVQHNITELNGVYEIAQEIFSIGKVLYRNNDKSRCKDYTFSQLMKNVRHNIKHPE